MDTAHCCDCAERAGQPCGRMDEQNWCRDCWKALGERWFRKGYIEDLGLFMRKGGYGEDDV